MEKRGIKIFLRFFLISSLVLNIFQIQKNIEFKSKYEECSAEFSPTYKYLDSLTIDSFEREVNSGRRIIIYIGRPDCNDCIVFEKGKCVSNVEWGKDGLPVEKLLNWPKKNDRI